MKRTVSVVVLLSMLLTLVAPLSASRYYDSGIGRWLVPDPADQYWSPYAYCGNNPIVYVDEDGEFAWFIPVIAAGMGYLQHGISTDQWGADAFMSGLIAGAAVTAGMVTGGLGAGLMGFTEGSAGFAISASTIGGAFGGATGSIGGQLYFNGGVNWNQVGNSAIAGIGGGLAGGVAGQYLTSNPVLTSIIGGSVGGGIDGSFRGHWGEGAIMGAWYGGLDASVTMLAYEAYGAHLAKKIANKNVDNCKDFCNELTKNGVELKNAEFGPTEDPSHVGKVLGCDKYGNHIIVSKEGFGPVSTLTGRQLSTGSGTFFSKGNYPVATATGMVQKYWGGYGNYQVNSGTRTYNYLKW